MSWQNKIDYTVAINLFKRKDRRDEVLDEMRRHGIRLNIWVAREHEIGATGLKNTMKELFEWVLLHDGIKTILVFEDDAEFIADPNEYMPKALEQLPEDFHLLYLGLNAIMPLQKYSDNLLKIQAAYSTHAILYSREAIELILPLLTKDNQPYDILLARWVNSLGKSYCTNPMLCTQRPSKSDIADVTIFKTNPSFSKYLDGDKLLWNLLMQDRFTEMTKHL